MRERGLLRVACCVFACITGFASGGASTAAEPKDMVYFLRQLTDLDRLPYLEEGVTCKQFSSYNRASKIDEQGNLVNWQANDDCGQYIRLDPNGEAVMAEMEGPGCIVQVWSANPQGIIRFYFDGAATPIELSFAGMTTGTAPPFSPPISSTDGAGCNSYLPMPYAKSCKVTADKAHSQYYHIDYQTFPAGTEIKTFTLPLSGGETQALNDAISIWNRAGVDPKPAPRKAKTIKKYIVLPPGKTVTLAELKGPAIITSLKMTLESQERFSLRKVLLRVYWDKNAKSGIEAPIGDFFGTGFYTNQYKSLPMGMTDEGGYCYWPMPFRRKGRIEVVNDGGQEAHLAYEIVYARTRLPDNTAYFHAKWRRSVPNTVFDWPFLECQGSGRYVGVAMNVQDPDPGWFGEGDEKVWVDGEKFPSWFGTGTEDYFGDAWGFRLFTRPMHGCTLVNIPGRTSVYRWHVMDSIQFRDQFKITIENYGTNKDYSCTAYWYQKEPASDFFESASVEARLPLPMKLIGIEAETLAVAGPARAEVISDESMPVELRGWKALQLVPHEAASSAELMLPVEAEDVYQVVLHGVKGYPSPSVKALIGNHSLGKADQPFATNAAWELARIRLTPPSAKLTLTLTSKEKTALVLDAVQLVRSQKQSGVLEAENLPFAASPDTKATREDARLDWSGWSQLLYEGGKFGDWLEVKLPADIKDRFHLSARGTLGPDYGIAQAFLGDQPVGKPADGYAEALRLSPENGLGKVELTGGENNRLRFQITGKAEKSSGYRLGLDYFRLNALVVENAIEAEGLKIVQQEMSNAYAQGMADFGADKWSGAQQLFCPGRKGQFVVLEVPVAEAGRYLLDIYFTKAADYGIVEVGLDGKRIGLPFDGYSGGVIPSGKVSYGECELTAGSHLLRLEVNGKNQASSNYGMGIDCLTLTPTGAAARRFGQHALNL